MPAGATPYILHRGRGQGPLHHAILFLDRPLVPVEILSFAMAPQFRNESIRIDGLTRPSRLSLLERLFDFPPPCP